MKIAYGRTQRGFPFLEFTPRTWHRCYLQKSSWAEGSAIVLGVKKPKSRVLARNAAAVGITTAETTGWVPYPIPKQVYVDGPVFLSREDLKRLMPALQYFLATGEVPTADELRRFRKATAPVTRAEMRAAMKRSKARQQDPPW